MFKKIKAIFQSKPSPYDVIIFQKLVELDNKIKALDEYVVALARLALIRPGSLVKEAQNTQANAEFLVTMVKEKENAIK